MFFHRKGISGADQSVNYHDESSSFEWKQTASHSLLKGICGKNDSKSMGLFDQMFFSMFICAYIKI